jgi:hypothetical protein
LSNYKKIKGLTKLLIKCNRSNKMDRRIFKRIVMSLDTYINQLVA